MIASFCCEIWGMWQFIYVYRKFLSLGVSQSIEDSNSRSKSQKYIYFSQKHKTNFRNQRQGKASRLTDTYSEQRNNRTIYTHTMRVNGETIGKSTQLTQSKERK